MKSLEQLESSRLSADKYLSAGDVVDFRIVDAYMFITKRRVNKPNYKQPGIVYGYRRDEIDGEIKPTFLTFAKNDKDEWVYLGTCFALERTEHGTEL